MSAKGVLSPGERLILQMLCDLHLHLKVEGAVDAEFVRDAITGGHLWALRDLSAVHDHVIPEEVELETRNILFMWQRLEESYDNLPQLEKDWLAANVELYGKGVRFPGFDGNNEAEHLSVARFLMEKLDQFTSLKDRADHLNSHWPTLDMHRRMLGVFDPIVEQITNQDCTAAQIAEVLTRGLPRQSRAAATT